MRSDYQFRMEYEQYPDNNVYDFSREDLYMLEYFFGLGLPKRIVQDGPNRREVVVDRRKFKEFIDQFKQLQEDVSRFRYRADALAEINNDLRRNHESPHECIYEGKIEVEPHWKSIYFDVFDTGLISVYGKGSTAVVDFRRKYDATPPTTT